MKYDASGFPIEQYGWPIVFSDTTDRYPASSAPRPQTPPAPKEVRRVVYECRCEHSAQRSYSEGMFWFSIL